MKRLKNTLYVTSPDSYLSLDGENIVILRDEQEKVRLPFHNLDRVVAFGYAGASPALMAACAKKDVGLCFLSPSGRFLAQVVGEVRGNVLLRRAQYRLADDEERSLACAKNCITGKIFNARWVIERALRDHGLRLDAVELKSVSEDLHSACIRVQTASDAASLRGIEGEAASRYFGVFDQLILQQKNAFHFETRNRRPPTDNVNALLSFTYTLLTYDIASALETVGLDPYVGFFHRDRPGRVSLALDLMEEMRAVIADRFVLTLINRREVHAGGFKRQPGGAVLMDEDTRKAVLAAWQKRKQEEIVHPYLQEKIMWGLVPHAQALLLSRYIRGDMDAYPPFMWK